MINIKIIFEDVYIGVTPHTFMDYGAEMRQNAIDFAKRIQLLPTVASINSHYFVA